MKRPFEMFVGSGFRGACGGEAVCDALALTCFSAEDLRRSPQRGVRLVGTWKALVCALSGRPEISSDKAAAGGFVLADLRDGVRRKQAVQTVSVLAFDYDAGMVGPEEGHALLSRYDHLIYTTASHEHSKPRWRAILRLSRPATLTEHLCLQRHAHALLEGQGVLIDPCSRDGCRLWYAPTTRPGRSFEAHAGSGLAVDVDALPITCGPHERPHPPTQARSRRCAYLEAAISAAARNVAGAPTGSRNIILNREAYGLARLEIEPLRIERVLLDAALAAGLTKYESVRTIQSALTARRGSR